MLRNGLLEGGGGLSGDFGRVELLVHRREEGWLDGGHWVTKGYFLYGHKNESFGLEYQVEKVNVKLNIAGRDERNHTKTRTLR